MDQDPAFDITIVVGEDLPQEDGDFESRLREAITMTLHRQGVDRARIVVAVVSDAQMAAYHRRHLGREGPTDVLAFQLGGDAAVTPGCERTVEGDIVLSYETASREASERGHDWVAEASLYAVHGTLHLLGYDDGTPEESEAMHRIEDAILAEAGWGSVYHAPPRIDEPDRRESCR